MLAAVGLMMCFIGRGGGIGDDKVVGGGIDNDITKTPYVVSIHLNETVKRDSDAPKVFWNPICAGTIFTALYVVTACHCVVGLDGAGKVYPLVMAFPLDKWAFIAGAWNLREPDYKLNPVKQIRTPSLIQYHPKCQPERTPWLRINVPINDVAVAKMARPFDVDIYVRPAMIFSFNRVEFEQRLDDIIQDKTHTRCAVSGWGSTLYRPLIESLNDVETIRVPAANDTLVCLDEDLYKLKFLKVQARYEEDCLDALVWAIKKQVGPNAIKDWEAFEETFRPKLKKQLCASNKNASPCRGDSGSGLVCDHKYIIGVNSFGLGCGTSAPDVFQSVFAILDWLRDVVCDVQSCEDVKHLHIKCNNTAHKTSIEGCQTTVSLRRMVTKLTSLSVASVVVYSRWLFILMVSST